MIETHKHEKAKLMPYQELKNLNFLILVNYIKECEGTTRTRAKQ